MSIVPVTAAFNAGYEAGCAQRAELITAIELPRHYTAKQRGEFICGFLMGDKIRQDCELMNQIAYVDLVVTA